MQTTQTKHYFKQKIKNLADALNVTGLFVSKIYFKLKKKKAFQSQEAKQQKSEKVLVARH